MNYDVIITGARCAGASLAILLGQLGYKVLLLDRSQFPSNTTSTHIVGEIDIYKELGVFEQLEESGAPSLHRMRIDLDGTFFESDIIVTQRALGLRRTEFDYILLQKASSFSNVTVKQNHKVNKVLKDNEGKTIGVEVKSRNEVSKQYGTIVIGADGRNSTIASQVHSPYVYESEMMRAGFYGYFKNVNPLTHPCVEWYFNQGDIIFCTPTNDDLHTILVMPHPDHYTDSQQNIKETLLKSIMKNKNLRLRLENASIIDGVKGIGPLKMFIRHSFGPGWALVGDAGAWIHPVSGTGMDDAVLSAKELSIAIDLYFKGVKSWEDALHVYQTKRDQIINIQINRVLSTLQRADQPLTPEKQAWLKLICTFPSIVYDLGNAGSDVLDFLHFKNQDDLKMLVSLEKRKIIHEMRRNHT
ncbi:NAD(P)/FAD-dependent oxidoreductase [Chengkuizengella sediminis]|uniref:NAD(P)/FAD-dependent oxidoreductase n=1 Tax=Chengkuizengella sediminis TaxID=1885917 RepID=UPI00138A1DC1|nr:NAD(P)/FAD-dependent oxidoreductase [Chengkuizengella sediminis]NDI35971.1 FAD-dependent monooxygenase [Chengkuizengella sediminis]